MRRSTHGSRTTRKEPVWVLPASLPTAASLPRSAAGRLLANTKTMTTPRSVAAAPGYRQMLADVASGTVNAVVAWHTDRLHRSPLELEEFIALIEQHHVQVEVVNGGMLDLSTPGGRMVARQLGAVARYESEHRSERVRRKHKELAEKGKWSGGGHRPYGYKADGVTLIPVEAAIIREAADRVLAGESLRATQWTSIGANSSALRAVGGSRCG